MALLIVRLIVTAALLTAIMSAGTPQEWRLAAGTVLGVGMLTLLIRDYRTRHHQNS